MTSSANVTSTPLTSVSNSGLSTSSPSASPEPCPASLAPSAPFCTYDTAGVPTPIYQTTITTAAGSIGGRPSQIVLITYLPLSSTTSPSSQTGTVDGTSTTPPSSTGTNHDSDSTGSSKPSTGLGTAAVAGAAVGGLVAGALLAGLLTFCIFKRRSRRDRYVSRNTYIPAASPAYGGEKGTPMVSITPAMAALDFLPQQADDGQVKQKLSTVVDQIDQHVENFYGNRGVRLDATMESDISRFETSELPLPLAACFQSSANPTTLIKHCLAFHIFNLTMAPGEGTQPLLPAEIAGMVTTMYNRSMSASASKGKPRHNFH